MYLIQGILRTELPFRVFLSDGSSRTCLNELTEAQLAELDIYPVDEIRPELLPAQYYGEPTITIADGKALVEYSVLDYSEEQLAERLTAAKEAKKSEIAAKLTREMRAIFIDSIYIYDRKHIEVKFAFEDVI